MCVWNSSEFSCAPFYHSYITRTLNTHALEHRYFQLRRQEILSPLEEMVQDKSSPSRPVSTNDTTSLKFSNAVWNAITKCWAENVFLNVLADRFLILSMQIFGRYLDWLCEIASSSTKDTTTTKLLVGIILRVGNFHKQPSLCRLVRYADDPNSVGSNRMLHRCVHRCSTCGHRWHP